MPCNACLIHPIVCNQLPISTSLEFDLISSWPSTYTHYIIHTYAYACVFVVYLTNSVYTFRCQWPFDWLWSVNVVWWLEFKVNDLPKSICFYQIHLKTTKLCGSIGTPILAPWHGKNAGHPTAVDRSSGRIHLSVEQSSWSFVKVLGGLEDRELLKLPSGKWRCHPL